MGYIIFYAGSLINHGSKNLFDKSELRNRVINLFQIVVGYLKIQCPNVILHLFFIAGTDDVKAFVGDGPILTDDKPVIEYFLSLPKNDEPGRYTGPRGVFEKILTP